MRRVPVARGYGEGASPTACERMVPLQDRYAILDAEVWLSNPARGTRENYWPNPSRLSITISAGFPISADHVPTRNNSPLGAAHVSR